MNHTKEAYDLMSKGKFIVQDSLDPTMQAIYDDIDENFDEYNTFFEHIGLFVERGNGYFSLCRKEVRSELERKIKVFYKWIKIYDFLTSYNPSFQQGFSFTKSSIEEKMHDDADVREKGISLFDNKDNYAEIVKYVIDMLLELNYIEVLNSSESKYRVTSAFNYLENLIECIQIESDIEDEIPE